MDRFRLIAAVVTALAVFASGCEAGTDGLEGIDPEREAPACMGPDGQFFPVNTTFGWDGCNQCYCTGEFDFSPYCTAALCQPEDSVRCLTDADCGTSPGGPSYDVCTFAQGCEGAMGYCMHVQTTCNELPAPATESSPEAHILCGCDGISYEAPTSDPDIVCLRKPWRSLGRCP